MTTRNEYSGCIGSYPLSEGTNRINVPAGGIFWRTHERKLKFYSSSDGLGDSTKTYLKQVPAGSTSVAVNARHKNFSSAYEYSWT